MISQDEAGRAGRLPAGDRVQRLAAVHRRRPGRASRRSGAGSSRTTGSRPSSPCPTSSSTTPASPPTSGSSPTARRPSGGARSSWSTPASCSSKMRKSLGDKRKEISAEQIAEIIRLYGDFEEDEQGQDPPQRGVRLPADHRRAAAAAALGDHRRHPRRCRRPTRSSTKLDDDRPDALVDVARAALGPPTHGPSRRWRQDRAIARLRDAGLDGKPHREGGLGRARRPRSRGADQSPTRKGNAEPDPDLRDNENVPAPRAAGRVRGRPRATASPPSSTAPRSRTTSNAEVLPVRPRRLDRPHQDQDRLRDPAHPPLLQVRPAAAAGGDRRRDQGSSKPRSRSCSREVTE